VIWLLLVLPLVGVAIGVMACLAVQRVHRELARRRYERLRVERQSRWAERRLHDIAQQAFTAMTEEARRFRSGDSWMG
jgi:predicted polyphosphate/ATP-dependent NAD kinase